MEYSLAQTVINGMFLDFGMVKAPGECVLRLHPMENGVIQLKFKMPGDPASLLKDLSR